MIGKGGEQITAIQAESQCVVQFAAGKVHGLQKHLKSFYDNLMFCHAESNGTPDRPCVLTGTPASIA